MRWGRAEVVHTHTGKRQWPVLAVVSTCGGQNKRERTAIAVAIHAQKIAHRTKRLRNCLGLRNIPGFSSLCLSSTCWQFNAESMYRLAGWVAGHHVCKIRIDQYINLQDMQKKQVFLSGISVSRLPLPLGFGKGGRQ